MSPCLMRQLQRALYRSQALMHYIFRLRARVIGRTLKKFEPRSWFQRRGGTLKVLDAVALRDFGSAPDTLEKTPTNRSAI